MKTAKKIILVVINISILCVFLLPTTHAQEWIYNGVDTENIPDFSVFPSEVYIYDPDSGVPPEIYYQIEIVKGNISDPFLMGNGTCVWGNAWTLNTTSGARTLDNANGVWAYWNETIGYFSQSYPFIIPVKNGAVSASILNNISIYLDIIASSTGGSFENQQIYPSIFSISHWNTSNNAYLNVNFTSDGILTQWECYILPIANMTLISQPGQFLPDFSFAPEHSSLIVNSTTFILNIDINSADNNNDGVTDTAYSMRHFQDSTWSTWGTPPIQLQWNLGPGAPAGNYTITIEVKNMYGVTQEQIEIQYIPPEDGDGAPEIPGFSIILMCISTFLGISFLIHKNQKKI